MSKESQEFLTLSQAAKRFPVAVSLPTMWRWVLKGVRGISLKSVVVGGRRYTRADWILDFTAATTAAAPGSTADQPQIPAERQANSLAILERAGIVGNGQDPSNCHRRDDD